jgi:hypothetical protein
MADPYTVAHIKLLSVSDTATLQTWLDAHAQVTIMEIIPNGLDLMIVYS